MGPTPSPGPTRRKKAIARARNNDAKRVWRLVPQEEKRSPEPSEASRYHRTKLSSSSCLADRRRDGPQTEWSAEDRRPESAMGSSVQDSSRYPEAKSHNRRGAIILDGPETRAVAPALSMQLKRWENLFWLTRQSGANWSGRNFPYFLHENTENRRKYTEGSLRAAL